MGHIKRSTARDFRINAASLEAALREIESEEEEEADEDEDDERSVVEIRTDQTKRADLTNRAGNNDDDGDDDNNSNRSSVREVSVRK